MKISTSQFFRNSISQMQQQQSKVAQLQSQLGSGKQLVNPSDDPAKAAVINRLNAAVNRQDVFTRNLDAVETRLSTEEVALRSISDLMQRVNQLTISAASDTLTAVDRKIIASEIEGLRDELFKMANTQDSFGNYIFAGSKTSEPAFVKDAYDRVSYNGDYSEVEVNVSENRRMVINNIGSKVFAYVDRDGGSNAFSGAFTQANAGDNSVDGWTINNQQLISGDIVAGFASLADTTYPDANTSKDNPTLTASSFTTQVSADGYDSGENSLAMNTSATMDAYGIVRGPMIESNVSRNMSVGDKIEFSYKATATDDQADLMAYLLNERTGEMQPILNTTTEGDGTWHKVSVNVESYGDYKVVFSSGAYDANGDGSVDVDVNLGEINVVRPGDQQHAGYFQVLDDLLFNLRANNGDGIRSQLDEVSEMVDNMAVALSATAGRSATIASQKLILEDAQLRLTQLLSNSKDLDYATAVTELSKEAMALEALQSSFAKISQLTLFNYIR